MIIKIHLTTLPLSFFKNTAPKNPPTNTPAVTLKVITKLNLLLITYMIELIILSGNMTAIAVAWAFFVGSLYTFSSVGTQTSPPPPPKKPLIKPTSSAKRPLIAIFFTFFFFSTRILFAKQRKIFVKVAQTKKKVKKMFDFIINMVYT